MGLSQAFDLLQLRILICIGVAMILGAAIGFERELVDKPAGLRTHILVAGAAAFFVSLGDVVIQQFSTELGGMLVRSDPVRVIEAVVTGVSFLGAGTIIVHRGGSSSTAGRVEGLTTAASILFAAAVGVSVALSQFTLAVGATIMVLLTLRGLGFLQRRLARQKRGQAQE
jgi:putative Mg2+ transporter-C (MgtC) family protein